MPDDGQTPVQRVLGDRAPVVVSLAEDEVAEAVTHVAFDAGRPRAVSALTLAQRVLGEAA